jgi:hypothetical protein
MDPMDRPNKLAPATRLFLQVQIFLTLLCFGVEAFCAFVLHLDGDFTYPLKTRSQTAWDFTLFTEQFRYFHHPEFFLIREFPYPAPVAIPYAIFFSSSHPLRLFISFILTTFLLAGLIFARAMRRRGVSALKADLFVLASLLLAYPLWFDLKQGNIEICVWILIAFGVWAFCKGRGYPAAAAFGIAGSMKIFPFVYVALFLTRRKYREVAFAAFTAACSTLISLWLVGPNIVDTWRKINSGIAFFRTTFMLHFRRDEIGFDHSLFGIYKRFAHHLPPSEQLGHIVNIYLAVAAVCGIALYILKIRHLPLINQALCLTVASILLPPISFDYTLMQLYIPWAMLVLFAQQRGQTHKKIPGLAAAFICFAILMSPQSEFLRHATRYGGQIKALVLIVLMAVSLKYPFASQDTENTASLAA